MLCSSGSCSKTDDCTFHGHRCGTAEHAKLDLLLRCGSSSITHPLLSLKTSSLVYPLVAQVTLETGTGKSDRNFGRRVCQSRCFCLVGRCSALGDLAFHGEKDGCVHNVLPCFYNRRGGTMIGWQNGRLQTVVSAYCCILWRLLKHSDDLKFQRL